MSDKYKVKQREFCVGMLNNIETYENYHSKIVLSEKATFHISGRPKVNHHIGRTQSTSNNRTCIGLG